MPGVSEQAVPLLHSPLWLHTHTHTLCLGRASRPLGRGLPLTSSRCPSCTPPENPHSGLPQHRTRFPSAWKVAPLVHAFSGAVRVSSTDGAHTPLAHCPPPGGRSLRFRCGQAQGHPGALPPWVLTGSALRMCLCPAPSSCKDPGHTGSGSLLTLLTTLIISAKTPSPRSHILISWELVRTPAYEFEGPTLARNGV